MFEESASIPSILASMNSWFTPAVLFVLLNLMIATILYSSTFSNHHQQQQSQSQNDPQPQQQPRLPRSPSLLQRLRSINLSNFRSQESITTHLQQIPDSDTLFPPQQTHKPESDTQYLFQQTLETETQFVFEQTHEEETETQFVFEQTHEEKEEEEYEEPQTLDEVYRLVSRTQSDTKPASGEVPVRLPQKMRKSASLKSSFGHFEEDDIVENRRPATVRERRAKVTEGDDQVDSKADDFINKFKQQLKLQRLDSIIRYKELTSGGTGK